MNIKNRTDIVHQIVEDLLDNDTLDINNFGNDVEAIVMIKFEIRNLPNKQYKKS